LEIQDKTAIVTGGASGIGLDTAREWVKRGGRVVLFDVQDERAASAAKDLGEDVAHAVHVDVSDEDQVQRGVDAAVERFGAVHVAVNAAGVPFPGRTVDRDGKPFPLEIWNAVVSVNLTGAFIVARLAAAAMLRNVPDDDGERGLVVNISSGAAWQGQAGQAAYSASKAGMIGMVLPVARDLAPHGIRVMAIAPGLFDTPMLAGLPPKALDALRSLVLFPKRLGNPSEIGRLVCTLAEVPYFNATCISLDGGARMG